jgi:hypothetical protein
MRNQDPNDPGFQASAWARFQNLVFVSEHALALGILVNLGQKLSVHERYGIVLSVIELLATREWPAEWRPSRDAFLRALSRLVGEHNLEHDSSFFASVLKSGPRAEQHRVGYSALLSAQTLLLQGCPREAIQPVAWICNAGKLACESVYREISLSYQGNPDVSSRIFRYLAISYDYAVAAKQLNDSLNVVLFSSSPFLVVQAG